MTISHVLRCRDCRDHYRGRTPDLRARLADLDACAAVQRALAQNPLPRPRTGDAELLPARSDRSSCV